MIEVVVGLGIATILAVALISTTVYTQKLSRSAKNRAQATKLAQQAVEQLRSFRDSQAGGFANLPATVGCYYDTSNTDFLVWVFSSAVLPCADPPIITPSPVETIAPSPGSASADVTFSRWVRFSNITASKKEFTVYVAWTGSSGLEYVKNSSSLSAPCTTAASACP